MRPALSRLMPLTTSDPLIPASPASLLSQVARIPLCWHPLPPYTSKAATDLTDLNLKLTLTSLLAVDVLSFTQVSVPSSECGHEHKLMYCQTSRFSLPSQYNTITKCIHALQVYQRIIEYPPVIVHSIIEYPPVVVHPQVTRSDRPSSSCISRIYDLGVNDIITSIMTLSSL